MATISTKPRSRTCRDCQRSDSEVEFKRNRNQCVDCQREYYKAYRKANSEAIKEQSRKWRANNVERVVKTREEYRAAGRHKELMESSPRRFLYILLRTRRRNQKIKPGVSKSVVEITLDDLERLWYAQDGKCALSGVKMTHNFRRIDSASIDRKDSSVGYILDNVQLVCQGINLLKRERSDDEALVFLEAYYTTRSAQKKPKKK